MGLAEALTAWGVLQRWVQTPRAGRQQRNDARIAMEEEFNVDEFISSGGMTLLHEHCMIEVLNALVR